MGDSKVATPRRRRFRFSLLTLVLLVLLIGSGTATWWNWQPWVISRRFQATAVSADGRRAVIEAAYADLRIVETLSGREIAPLMLPKDHPIVQFASDAKNVDRGRRQVFVRFSDDGKRIIEPNGNKVFTNSPGVPFVREWDAETGKPLPITQNFQDNFEISPDGKRFYFQPHKREVPMSQIVSAPAETIMIASFEPGGKAWTLKAEANIDKLEYSINSELIAVADESGTVQIFSGQTGRLLQRIAASGQIAELDFSDDNRRLAVANTTGTIAVWDINTGTRILNVVLFAGHPPMRITLSRTGRWLAASQYYGGKIWDVQKGSEAGETPFGLLNFTADETRILAQNGPDPKGGNGTSFWRLEPFEHLCTIPEMDYGLQIDDNTVVAQNYEGPTLDRDEVQVWRRRRMEGWLGYLIFPELWMSVGLTVALWLNIRKNRRA